MAEWWVSPPPTPVPRLSYEPYIYHPYHLAHLAVPVLPTPPVLPPQAQPQPALLPPQPMLCMMPPPKMDSPREIRNKAEKQRRDRLNSSIAELALLVPPVRHSTKKINKTSVLRYAAHYLRAHKYVFNVPEVPTPQFSQPCTKAILNLLNGFMVTTTYKGIIVVVSQNIREYLGYSEVDLLGKSVFNLVHADDRELLREQLQPRSQALCSQGELLLPEDLKERQNAAKELQNEIRCFHIRFIRLRSRSKPRKYVQCLLEGSFRMSDAALQGHNSCCRRVRRRRARANGDYLCSSGNDVVFIGVVRPCAETFINESALERFNMEYRTRHSIDGEILQCEQRIALVTGYMMGEVNGVNAMNFIHRDEVGWVIVALKEMYSQHQIIGESCYRLLTRNGQFIYMRTRGRLDVDSSGAVTSFVCTNTAVNEADGKQLIRMMKKRFAMHASYVGGPAFKNCFKSQAVVDPRQLEIEILNMITTLRSANDTGSSSDCSSEESVFELSLISPKKVRIVNAIEKIYSVMNEIPSLNTNEEEELPQSTWNLEPPRITNNHEPISSYEQTTEANSVASTTSYSSETNGSDLPSIEELLAVQISFEIRNTENYDLLSFTDSFDNATAVFDAGSMVPGLEFELLCPSVSEFERNLADPLPETSTSTGGKHSTSEDQDQMISYKKPALEYHASSTVNSDTDQDSPSGFSALITNFNEVELMHLLDSAMETMQDHSFPDLLISNEGEEIMKINEKNTNSDEDLT